jgi:hypothetical protein
LVCFFPIDVDSRGACFSKVVSDRGEFEDIEIARQALAVPGQALSQLSQTET